jgi:general secretion pathway protein H
MIVVVIVGIIAASIVWSTDVVRNDRDVEREAARLNSLLTLLREEALLQTRDYGVLFAETGYRFYLFDYENQMWLRVDADRLFAERTFNEKQRLRLELVLEGQLVELDFELPRDDGTVLSETPNPQVMVLSSGDVTPFSAVIERELDGARFTIETDEVNALTMARDDGYLR